VKTHAYRGTLAKELTDRRRYSHKWVKRKVNRLVRQKSTQALRQYTLEPERYDYNNFLHGGEWWGWAST